MKITFLGATHEVTGSCTLLEVGGTRLLIDCGMEQGKDIFENQELPVSPASIDAVLLTHAHIDHSGNLPLLARGGFHGSVYATHETAALSEIMLRDSTHIQEFEAEWRNRKAKRAGREAYVPIYDMADTEAILRRFRPCPYRTLIRVNEFVTIRFADAGHLLGSASIEVFLSEGGVERKMVFSGDLGNPNRPILRDPAVIDGADFVMIESTYGNRLHEKTATDHIGALCDVLCRTFHRGGNVVIPSFAVGRTQELLYNLRRIKEEKRLPEFADFKVYMDSPLAGAATRIFMQCDRESLDGDAIALLDAGKDPFFFDGLVAAETPEESRAINQDKRPKVIISASGMCEAGRIRHHLKHNLWRPECTILFVGYQSEGTLGRAILDGAEEVRLFGEEIEVRAEICSLAGISGHADRDGLLAWLAAMGKRPRAVFVNHGEDAAVTDFARTLSDAGYTAYAPYSGTEYDLAAERFVRVTEGIPVRRTAETPTGRAATVYGDLVSAAEALLALARESHGRPNKELAAFASQIRALMAKQK